MSNWKLSIRANACSVMDELALLRCERITRLPMASFNSFELPRASSFNSIDTEGIFDDAPPQVAR